MHALPICQCSVAVKKWSIKSQLTHISGVRIFSLATIKKEIKKHTKSIVYPLHKCQLNSTFINKACPNKE